MSYCDKISIHPHNYLLMTLDQKFLQGLFEHERLKPSHIKNKQWNVSNLSQLIINNKCRINNEVIIE